MKGEMKNLLRGMLVVVVLMFVANPALAYYKKRYDFPQKNWHKGPYVAGNGGMAHMANDQHQVTRVRMGGSLDPTFGLTVGWDILDWIGPMLQINYTTTIAFVGNGGGATGVYPAGTFPTESARLHAVDISLFARATLPYFTRSRWKWNEFKISPYAKLGVTGYILYVNSPTPANRIGATGAGPAIGAGVEFYPWEGFFCALDITESLIFQGSSLRVIADTVTQVSESGLRPQTRFMGLIGWHF